MDDAESGPRQHPLGLGVMWGSTLGLAVGAGVGTALGNLALGIGVGLAVGTGIGIGLAVVQGSKHRKSDAESSDGE